MSSNIKKMRKSLGLSQQKMSDVMGIPMRTIQEWESGRRTPPPYVERLVVDELRRLRKVQK